MSRVRYGIGCSVLLGVLLCTVVRAAPTPVPGTAPFTDPSGRYTFQTPPEWQPQPVTAQRATRSWRSENPAGSFQVDTAPVAAGTTLDDYLRQVVANIKQTIPDASVDTGKAQALTLSGLPARRLDYTGTVQGNRMQMAHVVALQNDIAYVLTASAAPATAGPFMDRVRIVLDSFAFLTPTVAAPKKGDGGGRTALVLLVAIALLALLGLLLWGRTRGRRMHRQRTLTAPIVGLGGSEDGPPGMPVPDDPHAYSDSATTPLALHGTSAMPTEAEPERRYPS